MSTIEVQIPDSIRKNAERLAEKEGCSLDQFISTAIAEKMAAIEAESYLAERARRGKDVDIRAILNKVPDVEPDPRDAM